ncbi:predicted protein [Sclerotinia sclerotiorum 1980 UF-70]|uniref:Uncharacterized protein n=1 Tax=Sclerotinia sclerotiorum (strain ATCC 18683 / 1980 / Ss-1) TaxID=665079 RepID=A7ET28_SCLS1|nr:predicted protein [Sclerotinia sclerotiorum 1980 UF-70]EDN92620.1 predicted protein [Sclerotinia sclerotiorum 1980 UF-70]
MAEIPMKPSILQSHGSMPRNLAMAEEQRSRPDHTIPSENNLECTIGARVATMLWFCTYTRRWTSGRISTHGRISHPKSRQMGRISTTRKLVTPKMDKWG